MYAILHSTTSSIAQSRQKGKGEAGTFVGEDTRGRLPSKNKTPNSDLEGVRRHIESFSALESHNTRTRNANIYTMVFQLGKWLQFYIQNGVTRMVTEQSKKMFTARSSLRNTMYVVYWSVHVG